MEQKKEREDLIGMVALGVIMGFVLNFVGVIVWWAPIEWYAFIGVGVVATLALLFFAWLTDTSRSDILPRKELWCLYISFFLATVVTWANAIRTDETLTLAEVGGMVGIQLAAMPLSWAIHLVIRRYKWRPVPSVPR